MRPVRELRLFGYLWDEREVDAVRRVLASGFLTGGEETAAFEAEFAQRHGTAHGIAFANGTVALTAIMTALGIGPGDEVIVPSLTFISTATSVLHVGAQPRFVDIEPQALGLNPDAVRAAVGPRTAAIMVVHYGGQPAHLDELRAVADQAGVPLIEDAAEAHGATYRGRPVGGLGTAAMFSFTPSKNLTTGEGGMVTTDDAALAGSLRLLRNHGQTAPYRHEVLGYNWRLTEMSAAMGRVQLQRLDDIIRWKAERASWLGAALTPFAPALHPPVALPDRTHTYMLYSLRVPERRDALAEALEEVGVQTRLYFPPAHQQPIFAGGCHDGLEETERAARELLTVPFHVKLGDEDFDHLAEAIGAALGGLA